MTTCGKEDIVAMGKGDFVFACFVACLACLNVPIFPNKNRAQIFSGSVRNQSVVILNICIFRVGVQNFGESLR